MSLEVVLYNAIHGERANVELERWVTEAFAVGPGARVAVAEVRCPDPSCPFVHTLIAIKEDDAATVRQHWLHLPLKAVHREDILALARSPSYSRPREEDQKNQKPFRSGSL